MDGDHPNDRLGKEHASVDEIGNTLEKIKWSAEIKLAGRLTGMDQNDMASQGLQKGPRLAQGALVLLANEVLIALP
ncbi:MAG TPA: hypothetical protein VH702_10010 [Vicinamibacterales bacterium]|jgi:hypothetical protein